MYKSLFLLVLLSHIFGILAKLGDPYGILGVPRGASSPEIRKAYKQLAKEWHPDKNNSPGAQNKFLQISEAYKLLSDAERRNLYDNTGRTDEPHGRSHHDQSSHHSFDPFEDIFNTFGSRFKYFPGGDGLNIYRKQSINLNTYQSVVMSASKRMPYLLLLYTDWCLACSHIEPIWTRLFEELEPLNFGMVTVHALQEKELASKLGATTVPYLILLLDGHPYHYTEVSLSMSSSLEFIKSKFPSKLVQRINGENLGTFLSGWMDNKVRVLIFGMLDIVRLRYLTVGWEFRDRAIIGYVQMNKVDTDNIRIRYGVSAKVDTLLVFHEDPDTPVASVAMTDLPYPTMKDIIDGNKFLVLPRLSSQSVFDALCPPEHMWSRRRLCVVLVTQDNSAHDLSRSTLRDYAINDKSRDRDKIKYAYIFKDKQADFVNALSSSSVSPAETDLHIVILWRKDQNHLKFEWLSEGWYTEVEKQNVSQEALRSAVHRLLHSNDPMLFETVVQELFDEHAQGIVWRIVSRLSNIQDYLRSNLTQGDLFSAASVIGSILLIVAGGFVMSHLVKLEEESINKGKDGKLGKDGKPLNPPPQLRIHELRGETYNGLVRLLKPGCRTVVLLCDTESKTKLLPKFHKACYPYRKNKTLMFAFLNIERVAAMEWYKRILILGLTEPRELKINPKNTIGTVVALNGHRKYYCIYHAKHPEDHRMTGIYPGIQDGQPGLRHRNSRMGLSGDFMGFSESDSGSECDVEVGDKKKDSISSNKPLLNYYSSIVFEDQLLEGLSNWLDRLFEGSTHRYHINYWTDWPGK